MTALCLLGLLALQLPPGMQERALRVNGAARWFSVHAPPDLPASGAPLVRLFHGTQDPLMKWEGGQASNRPEILLGSLQTEDFWIRANRAQRASVATPLPGLDPADGCQISGRLHPAGPGGAPVHFYASRDAEGARLAWTFLRQYSR